MSEPATTCPYCDTPVRLIADQPGLPARWHEIASGRPHTCGWEWRFSVARVTHGRAGRCRRALNDLIPAAGDGLAA